MKKTLLEHHYALRIETLRDDPTVSFERCIAVIESLASEHGWTHLCERECIDIRTKDIYTA